MGLLKEMNSKGIILNNSTYNSVMTACEKSGRWEEALQMFEDMRRKGVERDTITYSTAISACAKGGRWEEALGLLSEMASQGIERDTITYNAAISACEKGGRWEEAVGLLQQMASQGIKRDTITHSAAISACEEGGAVLHCDALYAEAYAAGLLDHPAGSSPLPPTWTSTAQLRCQCSAGGGALRPLRSAAGGLIPLSDGGP